MKVIALGPVFYESKQWEAGETFILKERKGFKQDSLGKLIPHVFTVDEQFSSKCMKKCDENIEEVYAEAVAPKKRGRPFGTKVENNNGEVI